MMKPLLLSSSIGAEEDMEQIMQGLEQSSKEIMNLASSGASSEQTLPNRQCRICYAPEEASGADPILLLGCTCKGDISYGHQSCLKKWFRMRFQRNPNLNCEVCRNPLGVPLKKIIRSLIITEVIQHAPQMLLLLQVPPQDLDRLQVSLETPNFYQLPSETRRSLEASFEQLAQEQQRRQTRRRKAFETAQSHIDTADRELSEVDLQTTYEDGSDDLTRLRLEDILKFEFLELCEVDSSAGRDPPNVRMFAEHPHPSFLTYYPYEGIYPQFPEGLVLRLPIISNNPEDRAHPYRLNSLLSWVSELAVRFVDFYGEDLIMCPNFMDNLFLDKNNGPTLLMQYGSEVHDNDDFPIAIPMLNPSSGGPHPVVAEAAVRETDSNPSRLYTYGQFQMFKLL